MKSILVIGVGRFGHHLVNRLIELDNKVMVVDKEEDSIRDMFPLVTTARVGDCTNPDVLKSVGLVNFDLVIVCIAQDFQSSLEVTSLVKEMGAKYVISMACRDIQAKFLLKNGADRLSILTGMLLLILRSVVRHIMYMTTYRFQMSIQYMKFP